MLVIGAIALVGGGAGVSLGSFVAGAPERAGAGNASVAAVDLGTFPAGKVEDRVAVPRDLAPRGYSCEGCDAGLHNDMVALDDGILAPLPPYHSEDKVLLPLPDAPTPDMKSPPTATVSAPLPKVQPGTGPVSDLSMPGP